MFSEEPRSKAAGALRIFHFLYVSLFFSNSMIGVMTLSHHPAFFLLASRFEQL